MTRIGRSRLVRLGRFTRASLEEQSSRRGIEPSDLVHAAMVYYFADRDSGRPGWRVPRFAAAPQNGNGVELELQNDEWDTLAEEARRQDADEERLLEHLTLYYLADLEAGRITARILRSLGDPPEATD
jgi:hypothetical protein